MGVNLTDVPDRYDVVFQLNDGTKYGFLLADSVESNLPFRTHKALYSYSPTFLERQNVSQQYGDNFQDFFLTGSQDDFSLGENQKFFRVNDAQRSRRYFAGQNVNPTTVPGNVTLAGSLVSSSSGSSITSVCAAPGFTGAGPWYAADSTNLYSISSAGAVTSLGAHGAGGPVRSICVDTSGKVYIAGSTALRKYASSTFSTFSSASYTQVLFLNNILFAYQASTDSLVSFDTSGVATTQFQWKGADGSISISTTWNTMVPYGGSIYICRVGQCVELWVYDGSGVRKLADFPIDFVTIDITLGANPMCVNQGIVYIAGRLLGGGLDRAQIYYYVNGSIGKLWESQAGKALTSHPACAPYQNGIVFNDQVGSILVYDGALGGVHTVAEISLADALFTSNIASSFLIQSTGSNPLYIYGGSTSYASTGLVQTSQYDFDNTLSKVIRGIKIDADIPANTSIDLAYQLDGCGGSYTSLQTGATSGTEYLLPASTSAHSISVQVTLNSSTGAATPTLKRVYVRAAPTLQQFRRREFLFDLSGGLREEIGKSARRNRDDTPYPYDPKTAANNLRTIATQTIPFTVQDRFDQFTCLADLQENSEGYDGFAIYEIRPDVFIGRINLREV